MNDINNAKKELYKLQNTIDNTIIYSQKYKLYDIYGPNELNSLINSLELINNEINNIDSILNLNTTNIKNVLINIISLKKKLINIIKNFGTKSFRDLVEILTSEYYIEKNILNSEHKDKFLLMDKFCHPINFKIVENDKMLNEFECFKLDLESKIFQVKVYGLKTYLNDKKNKIWYEINLLVDEILLLSNNNLYIKNKINLFNNVIILNEDIDKNIWRNYLKILNLKDILINNSNGIIKEFNKINDKLKYIRLKSLSQIVKEFMNSDLYSQRFILICLLYNTNTDINNNYINNNENYYLAYLLYDLLSNEHNNNIDTLEQILLYDSLPWEIKKNFKEAMKKTIQYNNNLYNYDSNKIPLEQQICLLKSSDIVKEKAITKLKEIKSKSEDSGSKAKSYLDGLLKIPFGIFKEENILKTINNTDKEYKKLINKLTTHNIINNNLIKKDKEKYTNSEILNNITILEDSLFNNKNDNNNIINYLVNNIKNIKKNDLYKILELINLYKNNINSIYNKKTPLKDLQNNLINILDENNTNYNLDIIEIIIKNYNFNNKINTYYSILENIKFIKNNINITKNYMNNINNILDDAVYGHKKAKRQIERIFGQWMNGEQSGYCFGFEGPPGVGKTSLAKKGIAECLKDEFGNTRPFSFIAIGGSSNGSTLEGHNYTYVGSTWGKIVDILIETNCMNPIIFIDELDKISNTEHGKEIIGILTHLIDTTQNDHFQDKYFSGIDLDLSKILFIFSYNDIDKIDKILLDRIHRIKFNHLSLEEKITITENYLLKEIYNKMGVNDLVIIDKNVIEYIIITYTNESGVRKLKELLFEIVGEINLTLLNNIDCSSNNTFPLKISIDDIKYNYLKDRQEIIIKKINTVDEIGVVSGLWANSIGQGGLLHIESKFIPSTTFLDLKLTGMQGDVMKESMSVAKTVMWSLFNNDLQKKLIKESNNNKNYGIHIHVPEGATPKDGPSAGGAITCVLYSLITGKKINKDFAITGEICLQGKIMPIGGLELKILGGIKSGATKFIYPKENNKDFLDFYNNLINKSLVDNIKFYEVEHISEIINLILL